jgi:hypothetical protein
MEMQACDSGHEDKENFHKAGLKKSSEIAHKVDHGERALLG